ncbi:MAG: ABC transporter permease [Spirochaetales bacterium]|nr:ABC transporter permease [Spirochaetales bacterium]
MRAYIIKRLLMIIPFIFLLTVVTFVIIQLPPGDFLTTQIEAMRQQGLDIQDEQIAILKRQYGLDRSMYAQYFIWIRNIITRWDFGRSFSYNRPVTEIIKSALPMTIFISSLSTVVVFLFAIPLGIVAAKHQRTFIDYFLAVVSFIGLSIPAFLLALVLLWSFYSWFGWNLIGLQSSEFVGQPVSLGKMLDFIWHLWLPVLLIGLSGVGGLLRVMRGNLLDEMRKPYVTTARSKGIPEKKLIWQYPTRIALNPVISTIGWILPGIVGGEVLVSIVFNLHTTGPILLRAVQSQDMYLAGSITMLLSLLIVVGTLISDILLAAVDPRIRLGMEGSQ